MDVSGSRPHVVVLGGGFGGLETARSLRRSPVQVTVIDRRNHHLFQPLLYEVATAALSAPDIAEPIRRILSRQRNAEVLMGTAVGVDVARRCVQLEHGEIGYDWLVLATGVQDAYFGHDDWSAHAPGLKTVDDALEIRRRFLLAFEAAEREADPDARRARLTFAIVGGGPTGVELAGTMSEIARRAILRDFRSIDTSTARVVLIEGRDRVLPGFDPALSRRARRDLEHLGVELMLQRRVTAIDETGVWIGDEHIRTGNVFWAAGVAATPPGRWLETQTDAALDDLGRVVVEPDLSVPGHPEIFVIGDLARVSDPDEPRGEVPGVAPAAVQMGRHAARIIRREVERPDDDLPRPAFRYRDRGMLATIGRARAVGRVGRFRFAGIVAWMVWAMVHIFFLVGFRNRFIVMWRWAWAYVVFTRGARVITGESDLRLQEPAESAWADRS